MSPGPRSGNQPDLASALGPSSTGSAAAAENNITFTCPGLTHGANTTHRDLAGSRNFWAPWSGQASGGKVATSDLRHMQGGKMLEKPILSPWFL